MRLSKVQLLTVAVTMTAIVIAGATFVALRTGDDSGGTSAAGDSKPLPKPSGKAAEHPRQAPEYNVDECEFHEPDGKSRMDSYPEVVSASGDYIAEQDTGDEDRLWGPKQEQSSIDKLVKAELDNLSSVDATAVNSRGMIVGHSETKSKTDDNDVQPPTIGWVYYDDEAFELTTPDELDLPGRTEVYPTDINEDGDISGYVISESKQHNRDEVRNIPLKWEAGSREATEVKSDDAGARTSAITEDGEVIGVNIDSDDAEAGDPSKAFGDVWKSGPGGKRDTLPIPHGEGEIEQAGDWLLSEGSRWNMTKSDDPQESELDSPAGIDSRGRVFGNSDEGPAVETESGIEELPLPDKTPDGLPKDGEYSVNAVSSHSGVISGNYSTGNDEDGTKETVVVQWVCQ